MEHQQVLNVNVLCVNYIWRPRNLSELTPMILDRELTRLGSEASISPGEMIKVKHVKLN